MKIRFKRIRHCFSLTIWVMIALTTLAVAVPAQSDDVDNPTPMTTNSARGEFPKGKLLSHYHSFTGGPGTVKIFFDFTSEGTQLVAGQLTDADGRAFLPVENRSGDHEGKDYVQEIAYPQGLRLIATYEIKRRQKLVVRVYNWGVSYNAVNYKVRVSGDGVLFKDEDIPADNFKTNNAPTEDKTRNNNTKRRRKAN